MTDESKAVPMLHEATTSEDVRSLLTFARAQGPAQSDLDRLSRRLSPLVGISVAELSGPMADLGTAPSNPAGINPVAGAGKGTLAKLGMSGLSKGLVAAGVVAAVGAIWWAVPTPPAVPTRSESVRLVVPAVREVPVLKPVFEPAQAPPEAAPIPTSKAPIRATPARVSAPKPVAKVIERPSEVELIRHAEELRAQPTLALQALNEHARLYPEGMLAQEREVLAIEALLADGQRAQAEARAATLAIAHPDSAHLRRVRVLLGAGHTE